MKIGKEKGKSIIGPGKNSSLLSGVGLDDDVSGRYIGQELFLSDL